MYAASAPEFNRHLIVKLKRELYVPCGLRSIDQSEGVDTGEVGIRVTQLNVIERVQEVAPELDVLGLGYMNILRHAEIRIRVTGSGLRSLQRAIAEAVSRGFGIPGRAHILISLEGSIADARFATEHLHLCRYAIGTRPTRIGV